jgi:hypothetical protein
VPWACKAKTVVSDANAYIYILGQELVRCLVLLQNVAVDTGAGKGATKQEAEETGDSRKLAFDPQRQRVARFGTIVPSSESTNGFASRQGDSCIGKLGGRRAERADCVVLRGTGSREEATGPCGRQTSRHLDYVVWKELVRD